MIPNIIHRIHFGSPVPDSPIIRLCLDSVADRHPGWVTRWHTAPTLLDHPDFRGMGLKRRWIEIGELDVPAHRMWAYRSDLYRLLAVYRCGGWYLDTDMLCIRPLDRFSGDELVLMQFRPGKVGEGVIAAPPRSERVALLIEHCLRQRVCRVMPPGFGPMARQHGWKTYPPEVFCPHARMNDAHRLYAITDRTHLLHVWHRDYDYDIERLRQLTRLA